MRYTFLVLSAVLCCAAISYAADSAAAAPAPAPITWSGFVDAYYSKNFNSPSTETNQLRNFDIAENQFTLSLAELVIQKQASPVGFRMDLDFGPTNDLVQGGNGSTLNVLQQGYLTAVLPIGSGLTVDLGKFVTHMGNEVIESKDNWNYSRSLLFVFAIPYYHTGIRLTYPVASMLSATLDVLNGWNSTVDNNHSQTLGLTLNYTASPSTSVIFNGISGFERPFLTPYGKKDVADFIVSETVNDNLSLCLNADYGQERLGGSAGPLMIWKGVDLYERYSLNAKSALALREEVYSDPYGYTTGVFAPKTTLSEVTVTYEYHVFDPLMVRCELRDDFSNVAGAFNTASATPSPSAQSQPTLLIGVVATF
jgi:opacity protein-like surface antigen